MPWLFGVLLIASAAAVVVYAVAVVVDSPRRERDSLGAMLAAILVAVGASSVAITLAHWKVDGQLLGAAQGIGVTFGGGAAAVISFARVQRSRIPVVIGVAAACAAGTAWIGLPT